MGCFDCDELQFHYGEGCGACIDSLVDFVPKNCMASKSCELACALRHSTSGDINAAICEYPRPLSRLTIERAMASYILARDTTVSARSVLRSVKRTRLKK
jgi:hypothetical protein